ncbi:ABC transporter substrate-binding protein [Neorhizobium alkalisoli]|uniref:Glycine betaine/proline transport system substrate-binding protein n=1 Tax=Neorhizobium alkalisoli TaxID=528178 RepID=A0A561R2C5_9HYPH|nr:ABC transporter substrate-binding protein [Neorhizobium alkalisoli]TWF56762.1 glycine betaine/proline transport system substrate-binding protein [Neorhizobium alkalisoli]
MKNKLVAAAAFAASLYALAGNAHAADCGTVTIAEMNWASAGVAANVDKIILQEGYGCSVELVTGDTLPTFTSMNEKGQPDIAPELWINAVRTPLDKAVGEGRLVIAADILSEGGVDGWWIPKFLADAHPDIKTVQQALEHPELFPAPDDKSKAAIYNCPPGWQCQSSLGNLYRALGAEKKGFELVETGSGAALDGTITRAFENKTGWLGYYWSPTAILGKYQMVKLSFGVPHDKTEWDACTSVTDCANPKVNSYPVSAVYSVVTKQFAEKAGIAMDYLKKRKWTNDTVNSILAWQVDNQGTNDDAARYFMKNRPEVWTQWVSPEVAEKVKAAL